MKFCGHHLYNFRSSLNFFILQICILTWNRDICSKYLGHIFDNNWIWSCVFLKKKSEIQLGEHRRLYNDTCWHTFKQRSYLFCKITVVHESSCSPYNTFLHVTVYMANERFYSRVAYRCIDRYIYVSRIDIAKIFPKRRNGCPSDAWCARENGRSENIFDHFELVCQHFVLDEPAHSMDVSIIRNVNFRRRNIIHTL